MDGWERENIPFQTFSFIQNFVSSYQVLNFQVP